MKSFAPDAVRSLACALRDEVHAVNCLSGAHRAFRSPGLRARFASPWAVQACERSVGDLRCEVMRVPTHARVRDAADPGRSP